MLRLTGDDEIGQPGLDSYNTTTNRFRPRWTNDRVIVTARAATELPVAAMEVAPVVGGIHLSRKLQVDIDGAHLSVSLTGPVGPGHDLDTELTIHGLTALECANTRNDGSVEFRVNDGHSIRVLGEALLVLADRAASIGMLPAPGVE